MAVNEKIIALLPEIIAWRHDIHTHPELGFEETRTAAKVASLLREFGCDEVIEGIGRTGVVGVIHGRQDGDKVIGLRADMDALPITETTNLAYASKSPGVMHACGHDGHTAMLLGTAKYLCETRNFAGTAVMVFQPAEELAKAGAKKMIEDGLVDRWKIDEFYGLHNKPGLPIGLFATRPGPLTSSSARITITIRGKGGHAARPHACIDPMPIAAQIILAAQTIVSRVVSAADPAVLSICTFETDSKASNVIPETVTLTGTVRIMNEELHDPIEARLRSIVTSAASGAGAEADVIYARGYPAVVNDAEATRHALAVAESISGSDCVDGDEPSSMGSEDFAFMVQKKPGTFMHLGNGDTAGVHSPHYNFNDEAIPYGCSWLAGMIEHRMPL